jgi:hypothetical protein
MKSLRQMLNSEKRLRKTDGVKMVKLPSGNTTGMPEHVTDYVEWSSEKQKVFDASRLNEHMGRNYFIKKEKHERYMSETVPEEPAFRKAHGKIRTGSG